MIAFRMTLKKVSPEKLVMGSVLLFNGSNYLYNLFLGRLLGPDAFVDATFLIVLGLAFSFLFGFIPLNFKHLDLYKTKINTPEYKKQVSKFMIIIGCYEFMQIIINHTNIVVVKHFLNVSDAGTYISIALIGRIVYIAAWVFIILLLPTVVQKQKEGKPTASLLSKYVGYISITSFVIIGVCYLFPELIISSLFGDAYMSMANLLWQYVLVISLFAVSNLFTYYFISLGYYLPALLSGILGISKIVLVILFHNSLTMVVQVQVIAMTALIVAQLLYYAQKNSIR